MINLVKVADKFSGNLRAHAILRGLVGKNTLLFLSGGTSPDYRKMIVEIGDILPAAVCICDERWGMPFHADSNELAMKDAGLVDFFQRKGIPFHRILLGQNPQFTADAYGRLLFSLFRQFMVKVGVMGVGANLHTAGIFPGSQAVTSEKLVIFEEVKDKFPRRITVTLKAFRGFSAFIILMFGQGKKEALRIMLDANEKDIEKYPAVFYRISPIKAYLITDIEL